MNIKILPKLLYALVFFVLGESTSIEELKKTFGTKICIEGSLSTITTKPVETLSVNEISNDAIIHFENISLIQSKKSAKSAQSELAELAQYNDLKYFFKLEKEEGPPHNKLFVVSLTLGDEKFTSEATSLKKAQEKLASIALENTEYEKPPVKDKDENEDAPTTPTVLLNNLSAKLGIGVNYFIVNKEEEGNYFIDERSKKSYMQKLNESLYSDSDVHIRKEEPQLKGPFKVKVQVGDAFFYGISHTIQSARHKAASKAVNHLIKYIEEGENSACLKEGSEEQCQQLKAALKSPISLINEAAQLRNLEAEFEVISESGPPHKRVFVTRCRLGHLSTEGAGKSKKESKKAAAVNMLDRIWELPEVSQAMQVKKVLKDKTNKKKKKKKVLKNSFDVVNMYVNDFVGSILDFGAAEADSENPAEDSKTHKSLKTDKRKHLRRSYQDEILELSNLLNFEIQFTDIDGKNEFYTLITLYIDPKHICLGQGVSKETSRDQAAKGGLKLLHTIGFATHLKDKKYTSMESEVKEKILSLLGQEIYEEEK